MPLYGVACCWATDGFTLTGYIYIMPFLHAERPTIRVKQFDYLGVSKRRSSYVVQFFPSLSPDFLVLSNTFPPDTLPTPLPPLYISLTPEHFAKKKG